ncbi:ATP/DNA binding protein [Trifolium repens]|nr:ATP/DNA binding protein [Trifolium repens]
MEEPKSIGVVSELKDRARFVPECLSFPSNIIPGSVFSLLKCIRLLVQYHNIWKANKRVRWESQSSKFIIQKMDGDSLKYATNFSETISEGVLCDNHDYVPALSELITLKFFLKFKNEEIDFLMESKYLQIDHEDEKFLSSAFPSD